MGSLALDTRREDGRAIVSLSGDLDLATVPTLRAAAHGELGAADCTALVLDLERLGFVDSTGIGCWIALRNSAEEAGKAFELVAMPPAALRTVRIAGLASLFGLDG